MSLMGQTLRIYSASGRPFVRFAPLATVWGSCLLRSFELGPQRRHRRPPSQPVARKPCAAGLLADSGSRDRAALASGENAMRERELALGSDPLVLFGDAFDAVTRIAGISVRGRDEMKNFIGTRSRRSKRPRLELDDLADSEPMGHATLLSSYRACKRRRRGSLRPCAHGGSGRSVRARRSFAARPPTILRCRTARAAASSGSCSTA
jgi:hypothetical protein